MSDPGAPNGAALQDTAGASGEQHADHGVPPSGQEPERGSRNDPEEGAMQQGANGKEERWTATRR